MENIKYMKKLKSFIAILTLACTLLSLASCASLGNNSNIDDVFSQLIIDDSESDAPAFAEHIYIIIPNGCSGELSLKARELSDKIESKTGILTSLKYDNELTVIPQGSCEILLGGTNRLASDNALEALRDGEYLCRWDDGALVVCGRSDISTVAAIEKFISDILPISSKYSLMPSEAHFEHMKDYAVKQIILNGYDLYDYALTYSESNSDSTVEKSVATAIRDFINLRSGYFLDIIPKSLLTARHQRVIDLSDENGKASISPLENGILLSGVDAYSLWSVAKQFMDDISASVSNEIIDLKYDDKKGIDLVDTSFESAFCFLKENAVDSFIPNYEIITLLRSGKVGVCFVGNPNDNLMEDFDLNIGSTIEYLEIFVGERKIMLMYDTQRVKSVEVTVDKSNKYLTANVEATFGEAISFIYIIDTLTSEKLPIVNSNAVVFCDGCDVTSIGGTYCVTQGETVLSSGNNKYYLASGVNLSVQNDDFANDSENLFYTLLSTKVICPSEALDYTLE